MTRRKHGASPRSRYRSADLPEMSALLLQAGFAIRNRNRADCARCTGRSRGTVAFTASVAYCHRCCWKSTRAALADEMGLLRRRPNLRTAVLRSQRARQREVERTVCEFDVWRKERIRKVQEKIRGMCRQAQWAHEWLQKDPDCEAAWDALARWAHAESALMRLLDWLLCIKGSEWRCAEVAVETVFAWWRKNVQSKTNPPARNV